MRDLTSEQMLQALMDREKVYDYAFFAGVPGEWQLALWRKVSSPTIRSI